MSRGLPTNVRAHLEKARSAAVAAVEAYNRPGPSFRTAHYIVMITIAWTALFHAVFYKRGIRPWHRKRGEGRGVRYARIDGEPKHWELKECLARFYESNNPPERVNLEFLVALRNRIEHRHLPELDIALYGECQAALINLDEVVTREFGSRFALSESLAVSLQFSKVIPRERTNAIRKLAASEARDIRDFIERFRARLPEATLNSMSYSFSVFLVPKIANRRSAADVAVEFVEYDPTKPEEMKGLEALTALIREKQVPVANLGAMKPSTVVNAVRQKIPFRFTMHHHTRAWQHFGVRPSAESATPAKTSAQFCVFDEPHGDYLYTPAWVDLLVRELADPGTYETIVGQPPSRRTDSGSET